MTISSLSPGSYESPLQKLQVELQSEVSSGTISSSDQPALSSALSDIDASLQTSLTSGGNASPGDLTSKIDDLISREVSSGKLSSDQATELKGVFKAAFGKGPGGAGGPPPSDEASSTDGTSSFSSAGSASDLLQQLIALLQNAQSSVSSSSYNSTGSSNRSSGQGAPALLIDYLT